MTLEQFYAQVGGDYADTRARLQSDALIKRFLLKYPQDKSAAQLAGAAAAADWPTAFRAAHTLKGVAQNLGLGRLYSAAAPLTELLRTGQPLTQPEALEAVMAAHEQVLAAVAEL